MCTVILGIGIRSDTPLILAANRDEKYTRPSAPPQIWGDSFAPKDLSGGGTWLGVNKHGVLVAVTNRFGLTPDPARRSRGLLVVDVLSARSSAEATAKVLEDGASRHNGCHLIVADFSGAFVIRNDGTSLDRQTLNTGWHVITERSLAAVPPPREVATRQVLLDLGDRAATFDALSQLLSQHGDPSFDGRCVHIPELGYGTKSSTILWLDHDLSKSEGRHAEGSPCTTPYADVTPALRELFRR